MFCCLSLFVCVQCCVGRTVQDGITPLHTAAWLGSIDVVTSLLHAHANVLAVDKVPPHLPICFGKRLSGGSCLSIILSCKIARCCFPDHASSCVCTLCLPSPVCVWFVRGCQRGNSVADAAVLAPNAADVLALLRRFGLPNGASSRPAHVDDGEEADPAWEEILQLTSLTPVDHWDIHQLWDILSNASDEVSTALCTPQ